MEKFNTLEGIAAPMPLINIDTDMLIPKQFLKTIKRTGFRFMLLRFRSNFVGELLMLKLTSFGVYTLVLKQVIYFLQVPFINLKIK